MSRPSSDNRSRYCKAAGEWLQERLTALLLVPLTLWFACFLVRLPASHLPDLLEWLGSPTHSLPFLGFMFVSTYHAWLGLRSVMIDYVQAPKLRQLGLFAIAGLLGGAMATSAIAIFVLSHTD
ncbi:MAG: succinate dehydrogenase, hydrophobic membrane anchor protein [Methylococcaceae bacterium]|nr:succinate dehydrogenase, hydrophobic membrane anchor protein [Methylococcaceae bacterium]